MAINQALIGEFDHEMANTRKAIERVPDAKFDWKPHAKSMSLGDLAMHIAGDPERQGPGSALRKLELEEMEWDATS